MMQDAIRSGVESTLETTSTSNTASKPFVGQWNRLVSRTNWEKGRIICEWREALVAAGAANAEYSDEAWAARVGGVSGQHIGRLRRVQLRFGDVHEEYNSLFWSHFFAALDWTDAEMWLEGAVQNGWSVSQMRGKRWETLGSPDELRPSDADIVSDDSDEDVEPPEKVDAAPSVNAAGQLTAVQPVGGDVLGGDEGTENGDVASAIPDETADTSTPAIRPFADLPILPDDLAEAFEQFKIVILAHKLNAWRDVSCDDVLASLNALKSLAVAPGR